MKDKKTFEDIVRKDLDVRASDGTYKRMRDVILDAHEPSGTTESAATLILTGRTIMRNPITQLAAAAVITLAVAFGLLHILGPFRAASTAYGMTDLSELLGNARTLHVQSTQWLYQPDPNRPEFEQATVIPCEVWVDVPSLRTHFISFISWSTPTGQKGLNRVEGVHDRQCAMDIDHTKRTVRFNRVSVVQQRLAVRDQIQRNLNHITEEQLDHFMRVGQESIKGVLYDIWEGEDVDIHDANVRKRARCWLTPATGEVGRIYFWQKAGDANWRLTWCADVIERDIEIPDSVFAFEAPKDYKYNNTWETAYRGEGLGQGWYTMGGARVSVAINFTLDDGSIIVAWHSDDLQMDRYQDQSPLFADLVPGGELPKLPMVVYGLKTVRLESFSPPEATYVGRHLASTRKDRWYYEWALYVPSQPLPASGQRPLYRMLCRFNLPTEPPPQVGNPLSENRIKANEFDLFVREAMAELSDDAKAPEQVTYETVMRWAKEMRASLTK